MSKAATARKAKSYKDAVEGAQIEFTEVDSSSGLCARGYNAATKTIYCRFKDGRQYKYPVPSDGVWKDFERATSPGSFVHTQLRKAPYSQVEDWK